MFNSILELLELKKNNWSTGMCGNMARIYDLRGTSEENVKEDLKSSQYT